MKRKLQIKLQEWYYTKKKKPLLIIGSKNVGKTFLVLEFVKTFFEHHTFINFEHNPQLYELFLSEKFLEGFDNLTQASSVLILDEINNSKFVLEKILSLTTSDKPLNCILISSNCQYASDSPLKDHFQIYNLFPMDYEEFMGAIGQEWYIPVIKEHFNTNKPIPDIVHQELLSLFNTYMKVGGMPTAINEYISCESLSNVPEKHRIIRNHFLAQAKEQLVEGDYLKLSQAYDTIGLQLAKSNKKFQYKLIRKGATKKLFKNAIMYLEQQQLVLPALKFSDENEKALKLYMSDGGLLLSMVNAMTKPLSSSQWVAFSKGLLDNYIAQNLYCKGYPLYFWESPSQAKVDFVLIAGKEYIPIEVKTDLHTRSKGLSSFREQFHNGKSIKIYPGNFCMKNKVKFIPFYAIFCL